MANDIDAVQDVVNSLSDEARQLLQQILSLEKQLLHNKKADVTDDIMAMIKGLIP